MDICTFHMQLLDYYCLLSHSFAAVQLILGKVNCAGEMCYDQVWNVTCFCVL
jgi:hypothetical protein